MDVLVFSFVQYAHADCHPRLAQQVGVSVPNMASSRAVWLVVRGAHGVNAHDDKQRLSEKQWLVRLYTRPPWL
jgi:hypothetical protein